MSQDQKGAESAHVQWTAGKINELLSVLHPEDQELVLAHLGLSKLDSGTIDPPPEALSAKKKGPQGPEMRGT